MIFDTSHGMNFLDFYSQFVYVNVHVLAFWQGCVNKLTWWWR